MRLFFNNLYTHKNNILIINKTLKHLDSNTKPLSIKTTSYNSISHKSTITVIVQYSESMYVKR